MGGASALIFATSFWVALSGVTPSPSAPWRKMDVRRSAMRVSIGFL